MVEIVLDLRIERYNVIVNGVGQCQPRRQADAEREEHAEKTTRLHGKILRGLRDNVQLIDFFGAADHSDSSSRVESNRRGNGGRMGEGAKGRMGEGEKGREGERGGQGTEFLLN